jgi:DNA-binding GntR family transcriptional regulator
MARSASRKFSPAVSSRSEGPLSDQIYQHLKWSLIVGDYAPGDAISIRRAAAEVGTSMMPVREALKRLVSERALVSSANRSFRVRTLEPKRISDLFFVRSCLEGIATELATPRLTNAQIDRLDELIILMEDGVSRGDIHAYLSHNYSFHFTVYAAAGNAELVSVIEGLWAQTGPFLADGVRRIGMKGEWSQSHRKIAGAIRARDVAGARQLIERDIDWGTKLYEELALGADDDLAK